MNSSDNVGLLEACLQSSLYWYFSTNSSYKDFHDISNQSTFSENFSMNCSDNVCTAEIDLQSTLSWYFSMNSSDNVIWCEIYFQSTLSLYFSMNSRLGSRV
jgi:hypothetical protein